MASKSKSKSKSKDRYIVAYMPDKAALAEYINKAKGPNRTMAEFAEECGKVSASTFSRIVNQKIEKPLSEELIRAIVEHAEGSEEIDFKELMRANGMVLEREHLLDKQMEEKRNHASEILRSQDMLMRNIIADELYARGHMLRIYPELPKSDPTYEIKESEFMLDIVSSFAMRIMGYEPLFRNFIRYQTGIVDMPLDWDGEMTEEMIRDCVRFNINSCRSIFLRDVWEPESMSDVMNTFVFYERTSYEMFGELLKDIKVHTYMTRLLIDKNARKVVEEKQLPREDGRTIESLFYRMDASEEEL